MECRVFLDIVVCQGLVAVELLSAEDEALLVYRYALFLGNLIFNILNGVFLFGFHLMNARKASQTASKSAR